jgi:glyoxylase-like metal-dependent hydrolase (beta-lactamase superfamily II)
VRDRLVEALKASNLAVGDVSYVINTHLHLDHCGCNDLFENARFIAHVLESPPAHFHKISGEVTLLPGVAILPTPGHRAGAISVFVTADRKYAVCGDALPTRENYQKHVPPFINTSPRLAMKSMDFIISWADVVIPGHDAPFEIIRKK